MSVYDFFVPSPQLQAMKEYAEANRIHISECFRFSGNEDWRVRPSFPNGSFAKFRRQFGQCFMKRA